MTQIDHDELRRLIVDEARSFAEVARRFGVSAKTIAKRARKLGVRSTHTRVKRPELHDREWLREQFNTGRSIAEVADQLGVTYGTVVNARQHLGVAPKRRPKRTIDVDEVLRRLAAGESQVAIGRALGHHSSAISKAVRRSATNPVSGY